MGKAGEVGTVDTPENWVSLCIGPPQVTTTDIKHAKKQKQKSLPVDREIQKEWSAGHHIWVSLLTSRALENPWDLSSSMGQ